MGALDGRVAIVTGAGGGIGREHALLFAQEGAKVVVNDLGGSMDGSGSSSGSGSASASASGSGSASGSDSAASGSGSASGSGWVSSADQVVEEIRAAGGEAISNGDDVADWDGGRHLIESAIEAYGDLHVLVNNAGILRDRFLVNMTEDEWDSVVKVHMKGHFVPTRHAATWWREQTKLGREVRASVVNTSSTSGLLGNPGQSNYGAAKAGIGAFTVICAQELYRYGVRVNAIAPAARTRMTESSPGLAEIVKAPQDESAFDVWDPANVSPLVGYLATESCTLNGKVFYVQGGRIRMFQPWTLTEGIERMGRWTIDDVAAELPSIAG